MMNLKHLLKIFLAVGLLWVIVGCNPKPASTTQPSTSATTEVEHTDLDGFWTCSMHPQIHQHEKGNCPICGMALIHVEGSQKKSKSAQSIEINEPQIQNVQLSKYTVVRKDVTVSVPVSGRMISSREVSFQVYESDLAIIKIGSEFVGTTSTRSEKKLKGRITRIDNLVDPSSRTIRVSGQLQESISSMVVESGFQGEIQVQLKNQIVIPEEALLFTGTKNRVYVFASDTKLEPREVQVGAKANKEYQILSGLSEGDVISASANFLLDSEAKIRGL